MNVNFAKKFEGLNPSINDVETGYNSLFGNIEKENHDEMDMDLLIPFPPDLYPNGITPFNPLSPLKREQLIESIKKHGVLQPITIRASKRQPGKYEILAGHNRTEISKSVGFTTIPYVQKDVSDAEATEIYIETNTLHRDITLKELVHAYHMLLTNNNRQGKRTDLLDGDKYDAAETLAKSEGTSKTTIFRTARLIRLIPDLLDAADQNELTFGVAYNLSFLSREDQQLFYNCWQLNKPPVTGTASEKIKLEAEEKSLTAEKIDELIYPKSKTNAKSEKPVSLRFNGDVYNKYFGDLKPKAALKKLIEILDEYFETPKK